MTGVVVAGLRKGYGGPPVLDGIDATFEAGRFTSLLGPSGSGKTTLLRVIGGFVPPDAGTVRIDGAEVTRVPLWRRRIGMVFQSYALFPHMSVADNVGYGLRRQGRRGDDLRAEVARALALVQLTGLDARRPKELSGGQQQRVALARAMVTRPRVLLLDEPLSALDRKLRQTMQVELKRIQRESGLTTIFVTHDQEEALALSDRIAILDRGRIVQEGTPTAIYERPATRFAATFLGDANVFEGRVRAGAVEVGGAVLRTADPLPPEGAAVTLAVRPEKMDILSGPAPEGANVVSATVRDVVYAGATSAVLLEGSGGLAMTVLNQNRNDTGPRPGEAVRLAWSPAQTVLLAD